MSGMKISLDAAMRARDVSPSGWRDDDSPDRDGAENTVTAERETADSERIIHAGIAADAPSDVEPDEGDLAASEASPEVAQGDRGAGQSGADGPRRHRRRRLRRDRSA